MYLDIYCPDSFNVAVVEALKVCPSEAEGCEDGRASTREVETQEMAVQFILIESAGVVIRTLMGVSPTS
jgi:hypothetical protein